MANEIQRIDSRHFATGVIRPGAEIGARIRYEVPILRDGKRVASSDDPKLPSHTVQYESVPLIVDTVDRVDPKEAIANSQEVGGMGILVTLRDRLGRLMAVAPAEDLIQGKHKFFQFTGVKVDRRGQQKIAAASPQDFVLPPGIIIHRLK